MTSPDAVLDSELLFRENPLILYRLARRKYADSLSGLGSAMYPGRWNDPGQEAIYTSIEPAVCVLERLVHTPKDRIPKDLVMMKITLKADWDRFADRIATDRRSHVYFVHVPSLPTKDTVAIMREDLQDVLLAFAVPSVIVPAWNVVLYPRSRNFWEHVSLLSVEPFDYDPRLFPEGTPWADESK